MRAIGRVSLFPSRRVIMATSGMAYLGVNETLICFGIEGQKCTRGRKAYITLGAQARRKPLCICTMGPVSYDDLSRTRTRGFRNGNWKRLNAIERGLYTASTWLARRRGVLVNSRLLLQIRAIIGKLTETPGTRAMGEAYRRASELYVRFLEVGVFEWAPQARDWFKDPSYVFWLGTL